MTTNFKPATFYPVGKSPLSVTTADVNGDGKPDLIVADFDGGVSVLLGDGSGTFGAATLYGAGSRPISVTTADVNNDGKLDLIVADRDGGVSVLLGDGSGTFAATSYTAGLHPNSVTAADVNNDGKLDLVVADQGGGVSVLLGNGSGTFATSATYAAGVNPYSVTTADINGDGKPDLVVADSGGGVSVLLGDGSGKFGAATSYAAGTHPFSATAADINGDGKPDLIVADYGGGVSVLLGDGSGGFGAATLYAAGSHPYSVTTADTNGDGKPDLVVADQGGVSVLLGDGSGKFGAAAPYAAGKHPASVTTADVNGDGKPDLVVADQGGGVSVLLNGRTVTVAAITAVASVAGPLGIGQTVTFTATVEQPITITGGVPTLTLDAGTATYDADTSTPTSLMFDYTVAAGQNSNDLQITALTLNGATVAAPATLGFVPAVPYPTGASPTSVATADVNRDGRPDLIVATKADGISVLLGNTDGTFAAASSYQPGNAYTSVTTADVNHDGNPDLIVADDAGSVRVLLGNGSGTFASVSTYAAGPHPISVTTADLNGDGSPDLLVADGGGGVSVRLNDGSGKFGSGDATLFATGSNPTSVTTADVNGDGRLDLIAADDSSLVTVWLGDGAGEFGAKADAGNYAMGSHPFAVTTADVNGDGRADLIVADHGGGVSVRLNDGSGSFGVAAAYATKLPATSVMATDVNGDGKLDLVVTSDDSLVSVLLGNGDGTFASPVGYAAGTHPVSVTTADVNGDGKPDLIVADRSGGVLVLLNKSTAPGTFDPAGAATAAGHDTGLVIDTTAPVVTLALANDTGSSADDNLTRDDTISGTGDAGATVTITDEAGNSAYTVADGVSGAWNYAPLLADGVHTLTVSETDVAGNTGTARLTFTLDTTAPIVALALAHDTGSSSTDHITSNDALNGTAELGSTVTISDGAGFTATTSVIDGGDSGGGGGGGGGAITTLIPLITIPFIREAESSFASIASVGTWSFTPTGLADGAHTLTVSQTDDAGNIGTANLAFTLDTSAPIVTIALANDTGNSNTDQLTSDARIKGTGDPGTKVTVSNFTGGGGEGGSATTTADSSGAWSLSAAELGLADGKHFLSASQIDAAGNAGSTRNLAITLDTTAPTAPTLATASVITNGPVTVGGASADEADATLTLLDNGSAIATIAVTGKSWSIPGAPLALGDNQVTAIETDAAGNSSAASVPVELFNVQAPVDGVSTTDFSSANIGAALGRGAVLAFIGGTEAVLLTDGTLSVGPDTNEATIQRLYEGLLGRANDAGGMSNWDSALTGGTARAGVAAGFLSSPEYMATHAVQTDAQFVASLYQGMLGRAAEAGGLATWTNELAHGASRGAVAAGIAESVEAKAYFAPATARVFASNPAGTLAHELYETGLGREVELGGLAAFKTAYASVSPAQLAKGIAGSAEFTALHLGQSNAAYVDSLYVAGLGRHAEPFGGIVWSARLDAGLASRADALLGIATSTEATAHLTRDLSA